MIAIDTSSLVAYLTGATGDDVKQVDKAFQLNLAVLPPPVLTEILSDPKLQEEIAEEIVNLPVLEVSEGYWRRAGLSRAKVLAKGFKARVADSLIAQSCLDHEIPIVTRDRDFRHFAKICKLKLL